MSSWQVFCILFLGLLECAARAYLLQMMSEFGGDHSTEEELTVLERFFNKAYNGVCGVLFIMSKDTASTPSLAMVGMLVDFLQRTFYHDFHVSSSVHYSHYVLYSVLAFNFYQSVPMHWHWNSTVVGWLSTIVRITTFIFQNISLSHSTLPWTDQLLPAVRVPRRLRVRHPARLFYMPGIGRHYFDRRLLGRLSVLSEQDPLHLHDQVLARHLRHCDRAFVHPYCGSVHHAAALR